MKIVDFSINCTINYVQNMLNIHIIKLRKSTKKKKIKNILNLFSKN